MLCGSSDNETLRVSNSYSRSQPAALSYQQRSISSSSPPPAEQGMNGKRAICGTGACWEEQIVGKEGWKEGNEGEESR